MKALLEITPTDLLRACLHPLVWGALALTLIAALVVQGVWGDGWPWQAQAQTIAPDSEVRIVAAKRGDRVEFALLQDGVRVYPTARYFPLDTRDNRWLRSSPITIADPEPSEPEWVAQCAALGLRYDGETPLQRSADAFQKGLLSGEHYPSGIVWRCHLLSSYRISTAIDAGTIGTPEERDFWQRSNALTRSMAYADDYDAALAMMQAFWSGE